MVKKNTSFAIPFIAAKTISGPITLDIGHMASMLTAFRTIVNRSTLVGPTLSQAKPALKRPMAVQALKPATMPAPVEIDNLIEWAKSSRKNGGIKGANVLTAARKRQQNGMLLNSDRSIKGASLDGRRSLMSKAAGMLLVNVTNPRIRKDQGIPTLSISA